MIETPFLKVHEETLASMFKTDKLPEKKCKPFQMEFFKDINESPMDDNAKDVFVISEEAPDKMTTLLDKAEKKTITYDFQIRAITKFDYKAFKHVQIKLEDPCDKETVTVVGYTQISKHYVINEGYEEADVQIDINKFYESNR